LGGTATLGDGATVGTFPTQLNPNGMSFDGGDYLDCGNVADYTDNFTLFCALSNTHLNASNLQFFVRYNVTYQYLLAYFGATGLPFFYDGATAVSGAKPVADGVFHTLASVVSGNQASVFVDGELSGGPTAVACATRVSNLSIGGIAGGLVGNIYIPQVYNFALTPTQLRFLDSYARKFVSI